ncbi:MAG: ATP-binding protein, partial [Actinobacteria bacterium]|nr:ATP-binding protein [Actinomycetota bacterium]
GGTGLGLSIVKHIATNHGGDVSLWSVEGAGSTFTIRFPLISNSLATEKQNLKGDQ